MDEATNSPYWWDNEGGLPPQPLAELEKTPAPVIGAVIEKIEAQPSAGIPAPKPKETPQPKRTKLLDWGRLDWVSKALLTTAGFMCAVAAGGFFLPRWVDNFGKFLLFIAGSVGAFPSFYIALRTLPKVHPSKLNALGFFFEPKRNFKKDKDILRTFEVVA